MIRVISRRSRLALLQVDELFAALPHLSFAVEAVSSYGDRHKELSLMGTVDGDFFTRELDAALLDGRADVAVHSAKDLPYPLPPGLELYCLTAARDKTDSLASRTGQTLAQLPAGARIGTSSRTRRDELLRLRPDLTVVSIRGTIEERLAQVDDGTVDALIVATCALQRLGLEHRIAERLPFQTHPLQGNLAVVGRADSPELKALFAAIDVRRSYGRVTLAGFGPGRPDLLTLAAHRALGEADLILHDDLVPPEALLSYRAEKQCVGKRCGRHSHEQADINELLYQAALKGKRVVRLKGGDPMVFAHAREEIDYLRSRFVEVDVIPGVSSGLALSALTGVPLTHRGVASSVAFVMGHGEHPPTPSADTLLYYMGGSNLRRIAQALLADGRTADLPALLVTNVSLAGQRSIRTTLGELRYSYLHTASPTLLLVGRTASLEAPVGEQRLLSTGTLPLCSTIPGERVEHHPLIRIEPTGAPVPADLPFDWIIFTSRHGVDAFFESINNESISRLKAIRVGSVGPITSEALRGRGIEPCFESPTESAEGLIARMSEEPCAERVLLPRSDIGLPALSEALTAMGHTVCDLALYRTLPDDDAPAPDLRRFTKVNFSSPSGVRAFAARYAALPDGLLLTARGATTANAIYQHLINPQHPL